jgi:hypothetical protein
MRRLTAMLAMAAVALMTANLGAQAKPSFAGEWKIVGADGQGEPGVDLIITQSAAAMTVEFLRGQGPTSVKLTYALDGAVSKNTVPGRGGVPIEQASRAVWAGNSIVVTTTTAAGDEKRTFSLEGGDLVVNTSGPARTAGASTGTKATYKRYQRGFGG